MKRFGAWCVGTALAVSAAGCPDKADPVDAGVADAGPAQVSEREPNDRADQAQPLAGSAFVVAALGADPSKPDEDWYALTSATPQQVDVAVSAIQGTDVVLSFFDADRNPLVSVDSERDGKGERFPNLALANKVFARVTGAKKGSGGAYTMTVLFGPAQEGFEQEPNNRGVDATALMLDSQAKGFLAHAGDEDWYRIELPAPANAPPTDPAPPSPTAIEDAGAAAPAEGTAPAPPQAMEPELPSAGLRVEVTAIAGARLQLSVLSAAEAPLFDVKASKEEEALSLRNIGVRQSDRVVYLVVKSAWTGTGKEARRGYNAEVPYTVSVSVEPAGANAEYEPNDDLAHATQLPRDGFREGFLSPKNDQDFYVFKPEFPVLTRLELSGVNRIDLALEVVREKEGGGLETVLRANDGVLKEPEILNNVFCPTACYVKVEGASRKVDGKWVRDYENAEEPYRLRLTVSPDTGAEEREPNNDAASATALPLGHPVRGTIQPRKDADFYRLDLSARPVRTPVRASLIGILKVDLGLYLHRVEEDGTLSLMQTSDRAKGEQPETIRFSAEPAIYVLEVRDSTKKNDANFQDRYQLTVHEGE